METINHEYYSLEVAKLLKETGFNWEVKTYYRYLSPFDEYILEFDSISTNYNHLNNANFSAPSLDVAQRWLREVKGYYVSVDVDCDSIGVFYTVRYVFHDGNKYNASYILEDTEMDIVKHRRIFDNYEEAKEAGIKKALEIILEKGE